MISPRHETRITSPFLTNLRYRLRLFFKSVTLTVLMLFIIFFYPLLSSPKFLPFPLGQPSRPSNPNPAGTTFAPNNPKYPRRNDLCAPATPNIPVGANLVFALLLPSRPETRVNLVFPHSPPLRNVLAVGANLVFALLIPPRPETRANTRFAPTRKPFPANLPPTALLARIEGIAALHPIIA